MSAYFTISGRPRSRVVVSCEHASNYVPAEYAGLGVDPGDLADHIGWDIGAADVARCVAGLLRAPAVLSGVSRLLIDCNRGLDEPSLIVESSDGVVVPRNVGIDARERERRVERFYRPYHQALDEVLSAHEDAILVSLHSFTPSLRAAPASLRSFDAGVLFDQDLAFAERFGGALTQTGLRVRYNEPYSGIAGLIFSARDHGRRHARRYVEIELNNGRLRSTDSLRKVAGQVALAIERILEDECESS